MKSPFPGMDPYLESPEIFPDLHQSLASEIRAALNPVLPWPYYARLEMRPEIGISCDENSGRTLVPDVAVVAPGLAATGTRPVAVLDRPRRTPSPSYVIAAVGELSRHTFVEIRDARQNHKLITLIEILSPSNKQRGADREAYERKQQEIFDSDANLVEIDLLRRGDRLCASVEVQDFLAKFDPPVDYVVLVNRAAGRAAADLGFQIYPVNVRDALPCIAIPLRPDDAEPPLDLQYVFEQCYESGPYCRGAINYETPPTPPLRPDDVEWGARLVSAWRAVLTP